MAASGSRSILASDSFDEELHPHSLAEQEEDSLLDQQEYRFLDQVEGKCIEQK